MKNIRLSTRAKNTLGVINLIYISEYLLCIRQSLRTMLYYKHNKSRGGADIVSKTDDVKKDNYLEIIDRLIRETKYGTVTAIIQDGKVIQVEKTDKIRLN